MKRIYRSLTDKKIAGVFGGIAEVYGLDPSLLRLGAIFLGVATGLVPMIVTYLAAWLILPKGPPPTRMPTPQ